MIFMRRPELRRSHMILIYNILLLYNIRAGTLKVALGTSHISLGVRLRGEKTWISCGTLVMILPEETVSDSW